MRAAIVQVADSIRKGANGPSPLHLAITSVDHAVVDLAVIKGAGAGRGKKGPWQR